MHQSVLGKRLKQVAATTCVWDLGVVQRRTVVQLQQQKQTLDSGLLAKVGNTRDIKEPMYRKNIGVRHANKPSSRESFLLFRPFLRTLSLPPLAAGAGGERAGPERQG